jgi:hypothetical protein
MSKNLKTGVLGQILAQLSNDNKRLVQERDGLLSFIKEHITQGDGSPSAAYNPDGEDPRPEVHPKAIVKIVDSKTEFQDLRAAVIVRFIKDHPGATIGQIAVATGFSVDEARYLVKSMRNEEVIRSEGARRGTRYYMWDDKSKAIFTPGKAVTGDEQPKRRGRPPGSKNKPKIDVGASMGAEVTAQPKPRGRAPKADNNVARA